MPGLTEAMAFTDRYLAGSRVGRGSREGGQERGGGGAGRGRLGGGKGARG